MFDHLFAGRRDQSTLAGLLVLLLVGLLCASGPSRRSPEAGPRTPFRYQVDINTAAPAELQTLPGIGPKLADEIISYRNIDGPIRQQEELLNVRGIGPVKLRTLGPYLRSPEASNTSPKR